MTDTFLSENEVRSYVPELDFLDSKDAGGCRICREDIAVVDVSNGFRTVAFRGSASSDGQDYLSSVGLASEERAFLESAIGRADHLLLHSSSGPILVFADSVRETGLLVLIRPHAPNGDKDGLRSTALVRALSLLGREDFLLSPAISGLRCRSRSEDLSFCRQTEELLYYADSLRTDPLQPSGVLAAVLRLAHFAGCDSRRMQLPKEIPSLTPVQSVRLLTFLLCSFLALRQRSGDLSLAEGEAGREDFACVIRLQPFKDDFFGRTAATAKDALERSALPFLACSCFAGAILSRGDGKGFLEVSLPFSVPKHSAVGSFSEELLCLSILFFAA